MISEHRSQRRVNFSLRRISGYLVFEKFRRGREAQRPDHAAGDELFLFGSFLYGGTKRKEQ
jgi:hypothetical protein